MVSGQSESGFVLSLPVFDSLLTEFALDLRSLENVLGWTWMLQPFLGGCSFQGRSIPSLLILGILSFLLVFSSILAICPGLEVQFLIQIVIFVLVRLLVLNSPRTSRLGFIPVVSGTHAFTWGCRGNIAAQSAELGLHLFYCNYICWQHAQLLWISAPVHPIMLSLPVLVSQHRTGKLCLMQISSVAVLASQLIFFLIFFILYGLSVFFVTHTKPGNQQGVDRSIQGGYDNLIEQ